MADDDIAELQTLLTLSIAKFEAGWQRAQAVTEKAAASVEKRTAAASANMAKSVGSALTNINARNAGASVDGLTKSIRLSNIQMLELGHSARSTFDILAAGGTPLRAFELEGARLVQTFAAGEGGLGGAIEGIGAAVAGLLTPTNIAIAAFAALGVGAIEWLTSEQAKTFDATAGLKDHDTWLKQILAGYDEAKKAADSYLDAAEKLPTGAVVTNLQNNQSTNLDNLQTAVNQVRQLQGELTTDLTQGAEQFGSQAAANAVKGLLDQIDKAGLTAQTTRAQYDGLITTLTGLSTANLNTSPIVAHFAQQFLPLIENAAKAREIVESTTAAIQALGNAADQDFQVLSTKPSGGGVQGAQFTADQLAAAAKSKAAFQAQLDGIKAVTPDQKQAAAERQKAVELDGQSMSEARKQQEIAQAGEIAYAEAIKSTTASYGSQVKKVQEVEASLRKQTAALTENGRQQAITNALAQAHVSASSADGQAIAQLTGALYDQKQALDASNQAANFFASTTAGVFDSLLKGGQSLGDIFANVAEQIAEAALSAELLGTGPLAGILGTSASTPGAPAGILGTLFSSLLGGTPTLAPGAGLAWAGLATGGPVRGPGSSTSDSIPAMLSDGEYVVRASAATRFGPLLEAINSGRIGHFANGGTVGSPAPSIGNPRAPASAVTINAPVTVNAAGGTPEQNADLAKQTAQAVQDQLGALFNQHLMKSARPGNALHGMLRGQF
jgi:hypothetical protein